MAHQTQRLLGTHVYRPPHRRTGPKYTQAPWAQRGEPVGALDLNHAIIQGTCITTASSQDITHPTWTGTPKAGIIFITKATSLDTRADDYMIGTCLWAEGNNHASSCNLSLDNLTTTNTQRCSTITNFSLCEDATVDFDAVCTVSAITGGFRLTWTTPPLAAYLIQAIAWDGESVNAAVGEFTTPDVQDGFVDVVHAADTPSELVFILGNPANSPQANIENYHTYGVWAHGVGQRALGGEDAHNVTTTDIRNFFATNRAGYHERSSGTDISTELEQHANGFRAYTRDTANGNEFKYLSINFTKSNRAAPDIDIDTYQIPTSTGDDPVTGVGFQPKLLMFGQCSVKAADTAVTNNDAAVKGFAMADGNREVYHHTVSTDAVGTSDTASFMGRKVSNYEVPGGDFAISSFVSMDADGFTINFQSAPSAVGHFWWYLAIDSTPPPDASHPYIPHYARRVWNPLVVQ